MAKVLLAAIAAYQRVLSPLLGPSCRFSPSCSNYADQSIRIHGWLRGSWLSLLRLGRCHPFHRGGYDPPRRQRATRGVIMQDKRRAWLPALALIGAAVSAWILSAEEPLAAQTTPQQPAIEPTSDKAQPKPVHNDAKPEGDDAPTERAQKVSPAPPNAPPPSTFELRTKTFRATVTELGAGLTNYVLQEPRFVRDDTPIDVVTTNTPALLPLRQRIEILDGNAEEKDAAPEGAEETGGAAGEGTDTDSQPRADVLRWKGEAAGNGIRLRARFDQLALRRKLEPGKGDYQLWSTLSIRNTSQQQLVVALVEEGHHYVAREQESSSWAIASRSPFLSNGICFTNGSAEREDREDIVTETKEGSQPFTFQGATTFGALGNVYFTQAIAAHGEEYSQCQLVGTDRGYRSDPPLGSLLSVVLRRAPVKLAAGESRTFRTLYYLGPKTPDLLASAGHDLQATTDVGGVPGINVIAQGLAGLLTLIHDKVGNWGLAIILLTFIVKLVLFPLTAKSFESMASMRRLKPEIDALNEKYPNDREKKGAAVMELYRKHKINPARGCLPQLLQLPIWWALYTSLSTNVELFRQPFMLVWQDLTAPDPYYILPLGMGALMFVQQKLTPSTMDPAQAKMMMYMMPTMFTGFLLFLPAGLCLYMLTNSMLTIFQQRLIEHRLAAKQEVGGTPPVEQDSTATAAVDSVKRRKRRGRA